MTGEWKSQRWGDLATLEYGKGLRGYKGAEGPYRVFGTNGPIGWHTEPLCEHASVIVGRKGAYRGIHYSPTPCYVIDTAFYLDPKTRIDMRWAYYELLTHDINSMDSGSAIPSTSRESFYHLPVRVPPLPEQKAIAHVLGTLDDKIALNRRMNETLEQVARALFKSWFVDFDPVRAKADGRESGLPPEIADLFPDSFEDSSLGPIPEGWEATCLGEVVQIHDSKRIPLSRRERAKRQGSYRYYGAAGILDYVDDYLFDGIYVLVGEDGSVVDDEDHPVVQYVWGRFWVNNHAHVLTGARGVSNEHLLLALRNTYIRPYVTGAVQPKLNQTNLKAVPFVIPDDDVCEAFNRCIQPLFARFRANHDESHTLAAIRDALLPKLLSGEIEIPEADSVFEGVAS
ncbi:MAG: restriction endonuclease subunit S [Phycisphaerae bacterium]